MASERNRTWEQMGAASGLLATLLFVIAFIVFLGTSPGGDPSLPTSPTPTPPRPSWPRT